MTDRPFRFGVVAYTSDLGSLTAIARRAEDLGYDTLLSPDPFAGNDPLTALSAAAAVTTNLHVGTFVLVDVFRDRHLLSWQARSLQRLTGGRFELGLGTGRPAAAEHARELEVEFGSAGSRIERLAATLAHLERQPGRPPILLAAGGPKMRALAARKADIVTLAWQPGTTEPEAESIVDDFRTEAGERLEKIELAANLLAVGDEPAPWLERFVGMPTDELFRRGAVTVLPGTPREGAEILLRRRERLGISYVTVNSGFLETFAPIMERLRGT